MSGRLSNPSAPLSVNPGAATQTNPSQVPALGSRTLIQQIRGSAVNGATGSGIPKAVSNVQANISSGSAGATSVLNIQFRRDPSDTAFAGVRILAKGYQGNSTAVQVGSSIDTPATVILNNTGESISIIIQPYGNGGNTPIASCPSVGVQLPKSSGGGVGVTTTTQIVTTPATGFTGLDGDVQRYSAVDGAVENWLAADWQIWPNIASTAVPLTQSAAWQSSFPVSGSAASDATIANELTGNKLFTASTATSIAGFVPNSAGNYGNTACLRRVRFRIRLNQTTNTRCWVGVTTGSTGLSTLYESDTPLVSIVGFRYSTHASDTKWQMYTSTSGGAAQTVSATSSTPDTNVHNFDLLITTTSIKFYIDGVLQGTLTTNIPATTVALGPCLTIDNVATANSQAVTFYYAKGTFIRTSM